MKFIQVVCRLGCLGEINIKLATALDSLCLCVYAPASGSRKALRSLDVSSIAVSKYFVVFYLPNIGGCVVLCSLGVDNDTKKLLIYGVTLHVFTK